MLEQTIAELEPILRDNGHGFSFTQASFQEVLTAKQFADEINSGQLLVRDAYETFWSYEEDAELWGVEGRPLLPAWKHILLLLAPMLHDDKAEMLLDVVSHEHMSASDKLGVGSYNPCEDGVYIAELADRNRRIVNGLSPRIMEVLVRTSYSEDKIALIAFITSLLFRDQDGNKLQGVAAKRIQQAVQGYDPRLRQFMEDKDFRVKRAAEKAFGILTYAPRIPRFETEELQRACVMYMADTLKEGIGECPDFRPLVDGIIEYYGPYESVYTFMGRPGTKIELPDSSIQFLVDTLTMPIEDPSPRIGASVILGDAGHYDIGLVKLLKDPDSRVRETAAKAVVKVATNAIAYRILSDIKQVNGLVYEAEVGKVIRPVHQLIKPKGYKAA